MQLFSRSTILASDRSQYVNSSSTSKTKSSIPHTLEIKKDISIIDNIFVTFIAERGGRPLLGFSIGEVISGWFNLCIDLLYSLMSLSSSKYSSDSHSLCVSSKSTHFTKYSTLFVVLFTLLFSIFSISTDSVGFSSSS